MCSHNYCFVIKDVPDELIKMAERFEAWKERKDANRGRDDYKGRNDRDSRNDFSSRSSRNYRH